MKKIIFGLIISIISAASYAKDISGFKEISFGTSKTQLESQGFDCTEFITKDGRNCMNLSYKNTVFGYSVRSVMVLLDKKDKVYYSPKTENRLK